MNRETQAHFSSLPTIDIKRSSLKRPFTHKTTFNAGELIPIYVDELLPGDTVKMNCAEIIRMSTPIYPVMDNAFCDVMFFNVPCRLTWDHWKEFWGENNSTYWEQPVEYEIPQIEAPTGGWDKDSIMDYMGIPTGVDGISVNHLPVRSYVKVWNDWFRDENLKDPAMMNTDETTITGVTRMLPVTVADYVVDAQRGGKPLMAAKFHDYFTSALISPQKGPDVKIPLTTPDNIPVGVGKPHDQYVQMSSYPYLTWVDEDGNRDTSNETIGISANTGITRYGPAASAVGSKSIMPDNLWALTNGVVQAATIDQLRQAIAIQEFYEAQARGGSRYIEFLKNIFGVTSPDARQQRSEYLGGQRFRINMDQVLQTSSTDETSPQGNTAAFSCTTNAAEMFTYSSTEHSYLIGVAVIRTDHTYQQGINRLWSRKKWQDFFIPQFAQLGEQAILNKEIYATGTSADDEAFGYQEAWADYRYKPSYVSGCFRSNYAQSLDAWHYADDYESQPYLSSEWIDETPANIDRTLAVQSELEDQFIADFYFNPVYVRPMPVYSIPGLEKL